MLLIIIIVIKNTYVHMSHQETIKKDIMILLLQLQASHSALDAL
jgi:hypothetical protein